MRQENYLIALFNKDLLDLRVRLPLPHFIVPFVPKPYLLADATGKSPRQYLSFGANNLTKALEWNLRYCLLGYLFDHRGLVRKEFVRGRKRRDSVERCVQSKDRGKQSEN
jgi:autophagy-related protein 9